MVKIERAAPIEYRLFMAGDYTQAKHLLQLFCERGECVSITAVDYVFKYGSESGFCVTLINYPRFPRYRAQLEERIHEIAQYLLDGLGQGSYTICGPEENFYYDRRDE
jgi:hypothetical protein